MKLLLQHRILLGYIILIAVISSMAATMLHERGRVHKIEEEITEIREANQTINVAHRHPKDCLAQSKAKGYLCR